MNLIKLFILGDIGFLNNILKNSVNTCKLRMSNNDKIILLGDNFYYYGVDNLNDPLWSKYLSIFEDIPKENIHSILGNHDYHKNIHCQINNKYWDTPNFYYKLNFNNFTDLFFIDTVPLNSNHASITDEIIENAHKNEIKYLVNKQLKWLDKELGKSNNKKKIIFGHYPIITNGYYFNKLEPLYNLLYPIFKKHNVDGYISGHEHNIQFLTRNNDDYILNQFICGSSSEYRTEEYCFTDHNDMFDNSDSYIIELSNNNLNQISIKFIDSNNDVKYSYII